MAKVPYLLDGIIFFTSALFFLKFQKPFKAKEVVLSCKTGNQAEAVHLALIISARFKTSLLGIRTNKTDRSSHAELVLSLNMKQLPIALIIMAVKHPLATILENPPTV